MLDAALLAIPILSVVIISLIACALTRSGHLASPVLMPSGKIPPHGCPEKLANGTCGIKSVSVMGGVDFVEYFTTYKLSDGTFDETAGGEIGQQSINSSYNEYTFQFLNHANKAIFDANLSLYTPQYGGFCAWAVAGEIDGYPWAANCMGPSGNKSVWTIVDNKLYFFKVYSAKYNFMTNPGKYVAVGDARWKSWFDSNDTYFDTICTSLNT